MPPPGGWRLEAALYSPASKQKQGVGVRFATLDVFLPLSTSGSQIHRNGIAFSNHEDGLSASRRYALAAIRTNETKRNNMHSPETLARFLMNWRLVDVCLVVIGAAKGAQILLSGTF
jgi:hypothetical protein